jgi:hypothetical protein
MNDDGLDIETSPDRLCPLHGLALAHPAVNVPDPLRACVFTSEGDPRRLVLHRAPFRDPSVMRAFGDLLAASPALHTLEITGMAAYRRYKHAHLNYSISRRSMRGIITAVARHPGIRAFGLEMHECTFADAWHLIRSNPRLQTLWIVVGATGKFDDDDEEENTGNGNEHGGGEEHGGGDRLTTDGAGGVEGHAEASEGLAKIAGAIAQHRHLKRLLFAMSGSSHLRWPNLDFSPLLDAITVNTSLVEARIKVFFNSSCVETSGNFGDESTFLTRFERLLTANTTLQIIDIDPVIPISLAPEDNLAIVEGGPHRYNFEALYRLRRRHDEQISAMRRSMEALCARHPARVPMRIAQRIAAFASMMRRGISADVGRHIVMAPVETVERNSMPSAFVHPNPIRNSNEADADRIWDDLPEEIRKILIDDGWHAVDEAFLMMASA